jgi:hypothetical protein
MLSTNCRKNMDWIDLTQGRNWRAVVSMVMKSGTIEFW